MEQQETILKINVDLLIPNTHQPRKIFNQESLKELSASIKEYGILNPILVRKNEDKYEIIAGERRYRAAKLAGLTEVPVIIKSIEDSKMAELALIENLQRENISPIEEAKSYEEILNISDITEQKLSEMIGKSQSFISNKLRLLKLPINIQEALSQKKISERHARSLMNVQDSERQTELLQRIIQEKLTVKELDNIINEKKITEEEIQSAIKDIMKSLNMSDEEENQKEEKESDNMNNGSFFPNTDNNDGQGNQMSLNSMNMQTMNGNSMMSQQSMPPTMPEQQIVQPQQNLGMGQNLTVSSMPQPEQILGSQISTSTPSIDQPLPSFGQTIEPVSSATPEPAPLPTVEIPEPINPIPDFSVPIVESSGSVSVPSPTPVTTPPSFNMESMNTPLTPSSDSLSLPQGEPIIPQTPVSSVDQPLNEQTSTISMVDTPLFNSELTLPTQNDMPLETHSLTSEPVYDVPVTAAPVVDIPTSNPDKLSQVQELLNSNGIAYKLYGNETGHCIIIEL